MRPDWYLVANDSAPDLRYVTETTWRRLPAVLAALHRRCRRDRVYWFLCYAPDDVVPSPLEAAVERVFVCGICSWSFSARMALA